MLNNKDSMPIFRAYSETFLEDAMGILGTAFEFAKYRHHLEMDVFYNLFINSGIAGSFERGNPKYVIGMSGIELVLSVRGIEDYDHNGEYINYAYTREYWCGWILAYFQWFHGIRFKDLHYYLKMSELERLYGILHEVSEKKALEAISEHIRNKKLKSRLQYFRLGNRLSQSELSAKADVSLRMIQQYEQHKKDINKASAASLLSLARALNCDIEDLMEWDFSYEGL